MGKHSFESRAGWGFSNGLPTHVFTETADNPTAEVAVYRETQFLDGTLAPNWEYIPASSYRATHVWHSYKDCPDLDTCTILPFDVVSWKFHEIFQP